MDSNGLVAGIEARSVPALARAISLVENARDGYESLLSTLHRKVGRARRFGITGPPGAGKSTLVERLVQAYRARGTTVAVVAVDPTSPFSGGALLGDRIRMESVSLDPGVYIRSMATRGAAGGLATTTREVCDVLDAFGFDRILIETVGVGQSELAIAASADTAVLVLVPESGDGVQVLKAGVMEIADLYVVNKADRPGADRLVQEVEVMLGFRQGSAYRHVAPHHGARHATSGKRPKTRDERNDAAESGTGWAPTVLKTVATKAEGIDPLIDAFERHYDHLERTGELVRRRRERLERHTRDVVDRAVSSWVWDERDGDAKLAAAMERVARGELSPYRLAHDIVAGLREADINDR